MERRERTLKRIAALSAVADGVCAGARGCRAVQQIAGGCGGLKI